MRRSQYPMSTAALVTALWVANFKVSQPPEGNLCPADAAACHFSTSYEASRALFRARAADVSAACGATHARVEALPETAPGVNTDVAVFDGCSGKENCPTLVHLSGVHGVEGFAGTAIQNALLDRWRESCPPAGTKVVLVHAVNAYGMAHGRRWNEDNVDMNRNLLKTGQTYAGLAASRAAAEAAYAELASLLNPTCRWSEFSFWFRAMYYIVTKGYVVCKRALVSGQYTQPRGVWYGGAALAPAHRHVLDFLGKAVDRDAPIVAVDVHTGLGPTGVDTLMVLDANVEKATALRSVFGEPDGSFLYGGALDAGGAAAGYDLMAGDTPTGYVDRLRWTRARALTQEFGTVSSLLVARALVRENSAFHYSSEEVMRTKAARDLRRAFYVQSAAWQNAVVTRGVRVAEEALAGLVDGRLA